MESLNIILEFDDEENRYKGIALMLKSEYAFYGTRDNILISKEMLKFLETTDIKYKTKNLKTYDDTDE